MSLAEGEAYNNNLMPIARGDVLPDRNIAVEYIMYDLWESMRAHDKDMADEVLEPVFTFMRAQTDPTRLKPMDLKEYFEYRERDVGKGYEHNLSQVEERLILTIIQTSRRLDAFLHGPPPD
jgi:aristolochene synthase